MIDGREPQPLGILKWIGIAVIAILAIDFLGAMVWALSGQQPIDSFYIGKITSEVIGIIK